MNPRRLIVLAPLLLALPALAADADTPEKIVTDCDAAMKVFVKTVSTVTDEASATAATPEIEKAVQKIVDIFDRMKKFPTPSATIVKKFSDVAQANFADFEKIADALVEKNQKAFGIVEKAMNKMKDGPPKPWLPDQDDDAPTSAPATNPAK